VKPGTRCECSALSDERGYNGHHPSDYKGRCCSDAVCMVTVRVSTAEARKATGSWSAMGHESTVPMCAACATFHGNPPPRVPISAPAKGGGA
jgi:hypothetical protein